MKPRWWVRQWWWVRRGYPAWAELARLTQAQRDSYLRHPGWPDRCACTRYTIHLGEVIAPDGTWHAQHRCQPAREVI